MEIHKIAGKNVYFFESVRSTMDTAKKLCGKVKEPVIVSYVQRCGRGRQGSRWVSNPGGLWLSVAWNNVPKTILSYLFILVAKATADTLESIGIKARIKIPNDILVENRKIAGILIENLGNRVIIGIGININNIITREMGDAISCKQILGKEINSESFLSSLLINLDYVRQQCGKNNDKILRDIKRFLI